MGGRSIVPDILMDYGVAATRTNGRAHYDARLIDESRSMGIFSNALRNNLIN